MEDRIPFDDCVRGGVYETAGRWWLAVFAGPDFIGFSPVANFLSAAGHVDMDGGEIVPMVKVGQVPNDVHVSIQSIGLQEFLIQFEKDIQETF